VGLLYLRARYYDPQLGRFLSRDPFPGLATIPQSLHPYAYVFNNPATLSDPSGHFAPILIALIIGGVAGGGFAAWGYMQTHPCADFWSDPAFQRAVLVGAGAGALGLAAGFLVVAFAPAGGLGTAIIVGAISGGVGGGVTELARQSLSGESINSQTIGAAMLSGVVSGAVLGGVGHEATKLFFKIPRGFRNYGQFRKFGITLRQGLERLGVTDATAVVQGSAVTGKNFRTGEPFDAGRVSDMDLAIASETLFRRAVMAGAELRSGGIRTGPNPLRELNAIRIELSEQLGGRPVNVMIFRSLEDLESLGRPGIHVP
jgi:hypothetical protein